MDLLVNELSIHEQFPDISSFRNALMRLMRMRRVAKRFLRELHCNSALLNSTPLSDMPMQQAIGRLTQTEQRAAMVWLTRQGSIWDDFRQHDVDDWLECQGDIVTDSAVGEAAFRSLRGVECSLASFIPSDWHYSPVEVTWRRGDNGSRREGADITNVFDASTLQELLREADTPIMSWSDLREVATTRFEGLVFAGECFASLVGVPFAKSSANRLLVLLSTLYEIAHAFDASGNRTSEGQRIYQEHFTGDRALFSDSSETEKRDFRNELTFPHPEHQGEHLFCTRHGKERHKNLRLHYSWSGRFREPVYIVYIGPKITRT